MNVVMPTVGGTLYSLSSGCQFKHFAFIANKLTTASVALMLWLPFRGSPHPYGNPVNTVHRAWFGGSGPYFLHHGVSLYLLRDSPIPLSTSCVANPRFPSQPCLPRNEHAPPTYANGVISFGLFSNLDTGHFQTLGLACDAGWNFPPCLTPLLCVPKPFHLSSEIVGLPDCFAEMLPFVRDCLSGTISRLLYKPVYSSQAQRGFSAIFVCPILDLKALNIFLWV